MEAKSRDSPLIDFIRVNLTVRLFVRDHLTPTVEIHKRAVVPSTIFLKGLAIRAFGQRFDPTECAIAWHPTAPTKFDMVSAGKVELPASLFLIKPPRHVEVHTRSPVRVMRRTVLQHRYLSGHARPHCVHHVLADKSRAVGKAIRERQTLGVQKYAR